MRDLELHLFSVTFHQGAYNRTLTCLGVPRIGETVYIDDASGQVERVIWSITGGYSCGRSVRVFLSGKYNGKYSFSP